MTFLTEIFKLFDVCICKNVSSRNYFRLFKLRSYILHIFIKYLANYIIIYIGNWQLNCVQYLTFYRRYFFTCICYLYLRYYITGYSRIVFSYLVAFLFLNIIVTQDYYLVKEIPIALFFVNDSCGLT